jgi:hypothetical protein
MQTHHVIVCSSISPWDPQAMLTLSYEAMLNFDLTTSETIDSNNCTTLHHQLLDNYNTSNVSNDVADSLTSSGEIIGWPAIEAIDRFVTPIWYVIGIPGNVVAYVVWIQRRMRPSSGCYLAALALDECIFLILQVRLNSAIQYTCAFAVELIRRRSTCVYIRLTHWQPSIHYPGVSNGADNVAIFNCRRRRCRWIVPRLKTAQFRSLCDISK